MRILPYLIFITCCLSSTAQDKSLPELVQLYAKEVNPEGAAYNGLSFLDTLLKNKRLILLGESSHGTEEYSQTKFHLIRHLYEKLGFKVVLFESPMANAGYVHITPDTVARELVRNSIQSLWHTETVSQLFAYIKSNKLQFGGFDPQFMYTPYPTLFYSSVFKDYPAVKSSLLQLEERVASTVKTPSLYLSLKDSFSTAYANLATQLAQLPSSPMQQWALQVATTNINYYKGITNGDQRDSCMARNIIWLAEHFYPNEKIIVWAHNTHIDKNPAHNRIMGKLLAAHFKDQLFGIGLYIVNGTTAMNSRKVITVKDPPKGSLEALLAARGFKAAFLETHYPAFDKRMITLHGGKDKQWLNLHKSFDAVIVINGVHAPVYLEE